MHFLEIVLRRMYSICSLFMFMVELPFVFLLLLCVLVFSHISLYVCSVVLVRLCWLCNVNRIEFQSFSKVESKHS